MSERTTATLRVTGIRSQNPLGFGGCIFTGVPIDKAGAVVDAGTYIVVKADRKTLGAARVEKGQWWEVRGPMVERITVVDGFHLREHQVDADTAHLAMPSGEHVVNYLAENTAFEGIGLVKARRLWERFGEQLYTLLDAGEPDAFFEVLHPDVALRLTAAWASNGQTRTLQWLQAAGFDTKIGRKVLRFFGDEAQVRLEEDPYRLLSFSGTWSAADALARSRFGVAADDPRRLRGAVEEACYRAFSDGHTTLLTSQLMSRVTPLLGRPPEGVRWRDLLARAVAEGLSNGSIVQTSHGLQPLGALVMERQIAKSIQQRLAREDELLPPDRLQALIAAGEALDGIELNIEQREALALAAKHPFACITGGAGVGKTTVLKSLYRLYDEVGTRVIQVALAGRAAKRMQEATGRTASTIASFLKALGDDTFDGPTVLVVDEASMVDIISMSRLCEALKPHVRLLLVGDPNQLMPVGPGLVLHCLVALPHIPVVELKTVKRYGGEIAAVATAVRAGRPPSIGTDETAAVAFLPCDERSIADLVVDLYGIAPLETQVLSPLRNGLAGTKRLNELCQNRFTKGQPSASKWNEEFDKIESCGLNLGDVVLCTRNMWDRGLQNGSLGRVVEIEPPPLSSEVADRVVAWVEWDDGVKRALSTDMLDDVELGFAVTVHKSQGSQWRRIIIPVTASRMLDRTLLYTAITRAQSQVILVGDADAAMRAIAAPPKAEGRQVALDLALAAVGAR